MLVIVVENVPPSCGEACSLAFGIRAGVYVGDIGRRVREMIWENVEKGLEKAMRNAWSTNTESGFDFMNLATEESRWKWMDQAVSFMPEEGIDVSGVAIQQFCW